ncbi:E3 ubiquitin-protein ligase TRAIP [Anthophora plagiata]
MNIVCVICSDLLAPSDDVFHTPCGHIFHFVCLTQWLERSKSCPQCRERTTNHKIHRIYFNFSNSDTIIEDTCSLQDTIDKLKFQLLLKEKDVKHYIDKSETLSVQVNELKKEVRKVESELNQRNTAIYALKDQVKYFKEQNLEIQNSNREIEQLKRKLENYKNIQTLLDASTKDVDEMISRTSDPNTLITYISVMKREMMVSMNKRRELRSKVRSLEQELTKTLMERNFLSTEHNKNKKLKKELIVYESEKIALQNKVRELEKNISLMKMSSYFNSNAVHISEEPFDRKRCQTEVESTSKNEKTEKENVDQKEKNQSTDAKYQTDSPYLPIKSRGVFVLKQHSTEKQGTMKLQSSILTKKPRIEETSFANEQVDINTITYNGFGGHSRLEQFPNPCSIKAKRAKDDATKSKRQKLDVENNLKITDF